MKHNQNRKVFIASIKSWVHIIDRIITTQWVSWIKRWEKLYQSDNGSSKLCWTLNLSRRFGLCFGHKLDMLSRTIVWMSARSLLEIWFGFCYIFSKNDQLRRKRRDIGWMISTQKSTIFSVSNQDASSSLTHYIMSCIILNWLVIDHIICRRKFCCWFSLNFSFVHF